MANGLFTTPAQIFEQRRLKEEAFARQSLNVANPAQRRSAALGILAKKFFGSDPDAGDKASVADIRQLDAGQAGISPLASTEQGGSYSPEVSAQQAAATQGLRESALGGLSEPIRQSVQRQDILKRSGGSQEGLLKAVEGLVANGDFETASKVAQFAKSMQGTEKERKIIKGADGRQRFVDTRELVFPDIKPSPKEGGSGNVVYSVTDRGGNIRYVSAKKGEVPEVSQGEILNKIGTPKASTNITLQNEGSIPVDHVANRDENGQIINFQVIPGSKTDREMQASEDKRKGRIRSIARAGNTVIQDLGRMEELLINNPTTSGVPSLFFANIPTTDAKAVRDFAESAASNIGLDVLQTMRDNSPTGGALGQVPIQQQKRLEQVYGSLESAQKPEVVLDNVRRLSNIYKDIVYGTPAELEKAFSDGKVSAEYLARYSERKPLSFDEFGQSLDKDISPAAKKKQELEAELLRLKSLTF